MLGEVFLYPSQQFHGVESAQCEDSPHVLLPRLFLMTFHRSSIPTAALVPYPSFSMTLEKRTWAEAICGRDPSPSLSFLNLQ